MIKINLYKVPRYAQGHVFILRPWALVMFVGCFIVMLAILSQADDPKPAPSTKIEDSADASASAEADIAPIEEQKPFVFSEEDKSKILSDVDNKVSENFKIPESLKQRVGFWFDIYTKYTSTQNVIHDADHPWIVFGVMDIQSILNGPENKWVKYHKAEKAVALERQKYRNILKKLSRKKTYDDLAGEEKTVFDLFKDVAGKRKKVFKEAASSLRSQLGQKDFILLGLKTSAKYLPTIEKIFEDREVPAELTRLPFVESSFNEAAVSKVGASGIWQLMPFIGHKFLKMDDSVDERNSPIKASQAAAKLLKQNIKIVKSWPLAITAYNHGTGGMLKASHRCKCDDLSKIIDNYKSASFGFASSNFFSSFLAALYAERYQDKIFGSFNKDPSISALIFKPLKRSMRLKILANAVGLSVDELASYNLDIRKNTIKTNGRLPKGYEVLLPEISSEKLEAFYKASKAKVSSAGTTDTSNKL